MKQQAKSSVPVEGSCHPDFAPVRDAFIANFEDGHEIGACVAVTVDGQSVVDLWGGYRDAKRSLPWQRDTLTCAMSVTKSIAALCVLMLVDRRLLDLEAPVARYWPEFATNGKSGITVRHVLAQLAGMPYLDALELGELWVPEKVSAAIVAQKPEWASGTTPCYHSFTAGLLYQELMRRADGREMGRFLQEEIGAPLGVDFHIGLNEADNARCAEYVTTSGTPSWDGILGRVPSALNRTWKSLPRDMDVNSSDWRSKEFSSGAGHSNARAIARLYGVLACGGKSEGRTLLSEPLLQDVMREQWSAVEVMTKRHFRFNTGFMMNNPTFQMGPSMQSFGHPGLGGAIGFADPDRRLAVAYVPNRMAPVADRGPYAGRLIDAVFGCVKLEKTT